MTHGPFVVQPGEGRAIDLGGFLMTVKATSDDTDGSFTLLEAAEPANFGPPMHIHRDAAEAFYVLEGEYVIFVEDREIRCPRAPSSTSRRERCTGSASDLNRAGSLTSMFPPQWSATSRNFPKPSDPETSTTPTWARSQSVTGWMSLAQSRKAMSRPIGPRLALPPACTELPIGI